MKRLKSLAFVYASIFSLLIGLGAGIFLTISSELISLFWSKRILAHPGLLLLQCLLFGLVIGILQLKVGAYPKTIKQIMTEFQETGKVEGASWRTWVNGTVILAGGASVGPEASMTGIVARQSSAMGQQLTNYLTDPDLPQSSLKEQFKALFRPLTPAEGQLHYLDLPGHLQLCHVAEGLPGSQGLSDRLCSSQVDLAGGLADSFGLCIRSGFWQVLFEI
ncbi:hypothetical protein ME784_13910 [Lactobacillus delbrueckii]|uniref:hypothetical protein n=1 Tax=Lactobacillus delbrueckii TaxID=1584 RepID=UPI001F2C60BE|nr:hypothetical protein [Lactobacillus delbrueckii]GHN20876.1 hypothetical protein ME784_13910 [Lactobacillus delbrueckii]GHN23226.1 hypothetical protein ME785_17840 [Lactobacillus delbrueckii]GHN63045.1 hypothetical protein ME807_14520 [Lactobacillus delbrueckii]